MSAPRHIAAEVSGCVCAVSFRTGALAGDVVDEVGAELFELATHARSGSILLDFSGVTRVDTKAAGKLIVLGAMLKRKGACLRLCCLDPDIHLVWRITGVADVFEIDAERDVALSKFPAGVPSRDSSRGAPDPIVTPAEPWVTV